MERGGARSRNARLAAGVLALAALALGLRTLLGERRGSPASPGAASERPAAPPTVALSPDTAVPAAQPEQPTQPAPAARAPVRAAVAAADADPWTSALAGLIGRVVEEDRTPVPGLRVTLLEIDAGLLFDASVLDGPEPALERGEALTDREGRFVLDGAYAPSLHVLGLDLGGPRGTLRVVERALVNGARTDLGDIVLAAGGVLVGRALDEDGRPVAGARVRAAPLPDQVLELPLYELREESAVAVGAMVSGGSEPTVVVPPRWLARLLDRLPVPTARTAADGSFRLEGVARARCAGAIDRPGLVGAALKGLDLTDGEEDVGDVVLARGRSVRGFVEDPDGEPIAGAEVLAGAELVPGFFAILQPCGPSDADGRFALAGVAEAGRIVAAARRAPHEPWSVASADDPRDVLVVLGASASLTVLVRDAGGEPLRGARVRLRPSSVVGVEDEEGMRRVVDARILDALVPGPSSPPALFHEAEPGRHVCASLGAGGYEVTATAPGLAPATALVACREGPNEVTLVSTSGRSLALQVQDARGGGPVEGARARVLHIGDLTFGTLASARTGAGGRARLGPFATPALEQAERGEALVLVVQHPLFGEHSGLLDPAAAELTIALDPGGALEGRVHWGGARPEALYSVRTSYADVTGGLGAFHLPRLTLTDAEGVFRFEGLPAGQHDVALSQRLLEGNPLVVMGLGSPDSPDLFHETVEVRAGETTALTIDLTQSGLGATARLRGRVRVGGRDQEGVTVQVFARGSLSVETDAHGLFETPPFPHDGQATVVLEGEVQVVGEPPRHMRIHEDGFELQADEVRTVDVDLYPRVLRLRVVAADGGAPLAEVGVSIPPDRQQTATDAEGEASLLVMEEERFLVALEAEGYEQLHRATQPSEVDAPAPLVIRLRRTVPCAGRVLLSDARAWEEPYLYVVARATDGTGLEDWGQALKPGYAFELDGLVQGRYDAFLQATEGERSLGSFELGPDGRTDLELVDPGPERER